MKPDEAGRRVGQGFAAQRERLMQRVTLAVQAASQKRTPVRTGTLRRSETTRVESGGMRGFVGTNVTYAAFVHARRPFFVEGMEDARGQIALALQAAGEAWAKDVAS